MESSNWTCRYWLFCPPFGRVARSHSRVTRKSRCYCEARCNLRPQDKEKQTKKGAKKITSFESLYIFLVSNFCTTWLSGCTNDVWSLQVASARQDEFVFTGFLACFWFWEKAITKKRMAILVKETKIKTSSLSLTLEPGTAILVRSIIFYYQRKQELKTKDGRDLLTT